MKLINGLGQYVKDISKRDIELGNVVAVTTSNGIRIGEVIGGDGWSLKLHLIYGGTYNKRQTFHIETPDKVYILDPTENFSELPRRT